MFASKALAYDSGAFIRYGFMCKLGWKALTGTNTLASYKHSQIKDVKSFMTLSPELSIWNNLPPPQKKKILWYSDLVPETYTLV